MTLEGVQKCLPILRQLAQAKNKRERNKLLKKAKSCIFYSISEISRNTLNGNITITKEEQKKLFPHRKEIRKLALKSKVPLKERKKIIIQSGGAFLPSLLWPALSYLGGKIADRYLT